MIENIFIPEEVVVYIEPVEEMATMHKLEDDERSYINADTLKIIMHLTHGGSLDSFFFSELSDQRKSDYIEKSKEIINSLLEANFITACKPRKQGLIKKVKTDPPLRVVFLELTKKCNLKCKHCYLGDSNDIKTPNNDLEIDNLISQIDELGVMEVQLTGGEPFLVPYMPKVIQELQKRMIPCSIFTNGTIMPENFLEYLSKNNNGLIFYISLDGFPEVHDFFRGKTGTYQKTVETIKKLLKLNCDVRINTSVGRHNYDQISSFIDFVKNEFNVLHRLVNIEPIGNANEEMAISTEDFAGILKRNNNSCEFLDNHDGIHDWISPACGIGSSMLFIDAYGNVSFCPTLTQRENPNFLAGNINKDSLKNIWENSQLFKNYKKIQCEEIENCPYKEKCKGGCRSRAYLNTGNINAPDFAMCELYQKI